jgi:metabolite-proton symporter
MSSPPSPNVARIALASFVGTAVEWYDYFIYALTAAVVFAPLYFPTISPTAGTMAAFATFAVGFIARPFGGIIMGHFGDRVGRKSMLVISLLTMGIATMLIGLLPTYETIGLWAAVLLVTLRFVQGLAAGGEWGGAVLIAVENAPPGRRILYGSFPQMGVAGGLILANLVFLLLTALLPEQAFLSWGWRIPFLFSVVLVIVGLAVRMSITEGPEFSALKKANTVARMPILDTIRYSYREVGLASGSIIGSTAISYIFITYLLSYATRAGGFSSSTVLTFTLLGAALWMSLMPLASAAADRYGVRKVLIGGWVGLTVCGGLLLPAVDTGSVSVTFAVMMFTAVFVGITYGPIAALFSQLFDAQVRYSGTSLSYQLGSLLGGGIAPMIATALYAQRHSSTPVTLYMVTVSLLSFACVVVVTSTRRGTTATTAQPEPSTTGG